MTEVVEHSGGSEIEEWRVAPGLPDYAVSSLGNVKRTASGKGARVGHNLAGGRAKSGYRTVNLQINGVGKTFNVHALVCAVFHGPRPDGREVAHGNGDRADNRAENLRWCTRKENASDREKHGTVCRGATHGATKTTAEQVMSIRADNRTLSKIAADYGIRIATVHNIKMRKTWKKEGMEA